MIGRALLYGFLAGAVGFSVGFFGPMILDPSSGNGPLLGIFITGPCGFVAGIVAGIVHSAVIARRGEPGRAR